MQDKPTCAIGKVWDSNNTLFTMQCKMPRPRCYILVLSVSIAVHSRAGQNSPTESIEPNRLVLFKLNI